MPASWTTIEVVPARMDFWQAGGELTPPARTRFVRDGDGWRSFPVLP
jgi:pyridoxamine 5'-phosphate oxidase